MIEKTEGIVLRSHPFSRTSRMVTWLTPDFGLVTTSIKGACRPKSFFLGQTDVGYRCELLFYRRDRGGVHAIREVCPLDVRTGLRGAWRAFAAADYACWLVAQTAQPMLPAPDTYALLDSTLSALEAPQRPVADILVDFELLMLDILGVSPSFDACQDCTIAPEKRDGCRFVLSSGKLGCMKSLSVHHERPDSVALSSSLVEALKEAQASARARAEDTATLQPFNLSTLPSTLQPSNPSPRLQIGIRRFLGLFITQHLDVTPRQRIAAYSWLDWDRYERPFLTV